MKSLLFITNFYPDPQRGGIERVTNILAKSFAEQGIICRCIYLYSCEMNLKWDYLPCQLISAQYDKQVYIEYIQKYNIDIIINQSNLYYSPFLREVCNVTGAKLITCLHNSTECKAQHYREAVKGALGIKKVLISIGYPLFAFQSSRKLRKRHRKSYDVSDLTVLLSQSLIKSYAEVLGLGNNHHKMTFMNNPLSFQYKMEENELQQKQKLALVVARLYEPQKKLSLLFKIWKQVENEENDWQLVIVGDGPDRALYEEQVKLYGLKNVSFEGRQTSFEYYRKSSIFCMSSTWEGFPMTLLESLQMGVVPIVMNTFPAIQDILNDGENGYVVEWGDIFSFARHLLELLDNEDMLRSMQQKALVSSERFAIGNITQKWINIFNTLSK